MPTLKGSSRREFMRNVAVAGAGSLLLANAPAAQAAETPAAGVMPQRTFGRSGIKVPILSLGTMWDTPTNQIVLKQAMNLGVTYWDTAESYEGGRSEEGIGMFFKKYPDARAKVFLVSKSYDPGQSVAMLDKHLAQSLMRMNTSYIDLYYVHSITKIGDFDKPEIRAWAEKAKAAGKIKLFGFSTHRNMEECLAGAAKLNWVDGVLHTYNYRIMHTQQMKDAVQACVDAGIGLTAMKTMGGGPVRAEGEGDGGLAERFLKQGYSPEQAKLKAVWSDERIASLCSQMPNLAQLGANAAAAMDKTKLSAADLDYLRQYALNTACDYCAGCTGVCEGILGANAPVGEVMRALMYARSYGDLKRARELYAQLPAAALARLGADGLARAEANCPQGLAIASLLGQAQEMLA
ncbi:MAG: aldo/keto reductase [Thermodesulfobacteriota bacterium]